MKVHFGGSGRGFENLEENYFLIRDMIRTLGHSISRDWISNEIIKSTPSLKVAFRETVKAINESDAVVLEGTYDTSSVGKQLTLALNNRTPVLILYFQNIKSNPSLDKFIDSQTSKLVRKSQYTKENIKNVLKDFFDWAEENTKLVRFNLEIDRKLDNHLRKKAGKEGSSKAEVIRNLILEDMEKEREI